MPEALTNGQEGLTTATQCSLWQGLTIENCFYQASGYKNWLHSCPCEQCDLRRIELYSRIPVLPSGLTVKDEQQNTEYVIYGLLDHELPVKGTYVDPRIVPGYKYSVRQLGKSTTTVFNEPRRLLSIGQGYGKRLTFQSAGKGGDHFWSDSNPDGFGLSLVAVEPGQQFTLHAGAGEIGRLTVTWVAPEVLQDPVVSAETSARIGVAFKADVSLNACDCGGQEHKNLPVQGVACMEIKGGAAAVSVIEGVSLPGHETLHLKPLEAAE